MYICLCNPFSDRDVKAFFQKNKGEKPTVGNVYKACSEGEKPQCCNCIETLKEVISECNQAETA